MSPRERSVAPSTRLGSGPVFVETFRNAHTSRTSTTPSTRALLHDALQLCSCRTRTSARARAPSTAVGSTASTRLAQVSLETILLFLKPEVYLRVPFLSCYRDLYSTRNKRTNVQCSPGILFKVGSMNDFV